MNEQSQDEVLQYLLGEMEPGQRAAFEARLERDPAQRAALKTSAEALAQFAMDTAPAEAVAPVDQRAALNVILAAARPVPAAPPVSRKVIPWTRYAWPIAAALLLGLNLVEFQRPIGSAASPEASERALTTASDVSARDDGSPVNLPDAAGRQRSGDPARGPQPATRAGAERSGVSSGAVAVKGSLLPRMELEKLRRENAQLERSNHELRRAWMQLGERVAAERALDRLVPMELVDPETYARGERRGLVEVAKSILTDPEVMTPQPAPAPASEQGVVTAIVTSAGTAGEPTFSTTAGGSSQVDLSTLAGDGVVQPVPTVAAPDGPLATSASTPVNLGASTTAKPYAWSVYDERQGRGYLNLYNVPSIAADQSLQLWVKPAGSETFTRVGEVPVQTQGGNGSFFYTLPDASTGAPSEVLVTQEPRNTVPTVPTGAVILRGP